MPTKFYRKICPYAHNICYSKDSFTCNTNNQWVYCGKFKEFRSKKVAYRERGRKWLK